MKEIRVENGEIVFINGKEYFFNGIDLVKITPFEFNELVIIPPLERTDRLFRLRQ